MTVRWAAIVGCWLAWGLIYASRLRLVVSDITWGQALLYGMPDALLWAGLTPIPVVLARRFPLRRGRLIGSVPVHVLAALGIAIVHAVIDAAMNVWLDPHSAFVPMLAHLIRYGLHTNLMLYCVIVGVYLFFAHRQQAAELRAQLTQAKLDTLQMQLRPHFLFNALNTVSGLVEKDVEEGRRVLAQLGDVLRAVLQRRDSQEVSLAEELDLVRAYLNIETARFGDRLEIHVDVADPARSLAVPSFLLQPLVENAVTHGIARRSKGGRIDITARRSGSRLLLEVRDNGPDRGSEVAVGGQGIGLANARARLQQLYGDEQELRAERNDLGGWTVSVSLPARRFVDPVRRSA